MSAKALANLWQKPLLKLDVGKLFGSLVGDTESNTRRALEMAEAMAPAILWIDEIFFVDLPSESERKEIFSIQLKKYKRDDKQFDLNLLAESSQNYTGAEIEQAIIDAMYNCWNSENKDLTTEAILNSIYNINPMASGMMKGNIDSMRNIYLTGAHETSDYGIDLYGTHKIAELLESVCREYPNCNYVIGCFHPAGLTDDVIDVIGKYQNIIEIMVHVQHNDDKILRSMNRPSHDFTMKRIIKLREKRPDLVISTEVIVGFPGETGEKFQKLVDFLDLGLFQDIGVASFEPVLNTKAARIPKCPSYEVRNSRMEYIKQRYNCCAYEAPRDLKPILETYLNAVTYLKNLPSMILLPETRQKYQYIGGIDTELKMPENFMALLTELVEEVKSARDEFAIEQEKAKLRNKYTYEFRQFVYEILVNSVDGKRLIMDRVKKVLLD